MTSRAARAIVAAGVAALSTGVSANYIFCEFKCGNDIKNGCYETTCPKPDQGCLFWGSQAFADQTVCSLYQQSNPDCNGATHECAEAADFQLIYTRLNDLARTYDVEDFGGVAKLFHPQGAIFTPGDTTFHFQGEVKDMMQKLHDETKAPISAKVQQVLTSGSGDERVIHSIGTWALSSGPGLAATDLPFYGRWVFTGRSWVLESLIVTEPKTDAKLDASPMDPSLFDAIKAREEHLTKLYNDKSSAQLVKELYADGAVIVPREGKLVSKDGAADFFGKAPLGSNAKFYPTIVSQAPGSKVALEIGYSDSSSSGYFARWVQREVNGNTEWAIESHLFAVFPQVHLEESADDLIV